MKKCIEAIVKKAKINILNEKFSNLSKVLRGKKWLVKIKRKK